MTTDHRRETAEKLHRLTLAFMSAKWAGDVEAMRSIRDQTRALDCRALAGRFRRADHPGLANAAAALSVEASGPGPLASALDRRMGRIFGQGRTAG